MRADSFLRVLITAVPRQLGAQGSRRDQEEELDPQVSREEIMSREVELGCESWTSSLRVVPQQRCKRTLSL